MATQQAETLEFFSKTASDWRQKADGLVPNKVNVIRQRNDYVLSVAKQRQSSSSLLDVGCGTGELVCESAEFVAHPVGIDFAPDMIELCESRRREAHIENAEFMRASIFEYQPGREFDVISANGFIEYISLDELHRFLDWTAVHLEHGGSFVVGSRNRLFNVFSLNDFTRMEIASSSISQLIDESLLIVQSGDIQECVALLERFETSLPVEVAHPMTAIQVATRHQYTPAQLMALVSQHGFQTVDIHPIHYHGVHPKFKAVHPDVHFGLANLANQFSCEVASKQYLIPNSSTFMLHAKR